MKTKLEMSSFAATLTFPGGLPAFEHETQFRLHLDPASEPVGSLRSCVTPSLRFLVVPVLEIEREYALEMAHEDLVLLGLDGETPPVIGIDVECLAILAAREGQPVTANLLAPVVINRRNSRGVQAVRLDSRYSHSHPLAGGPGDVQC